MKPCYSHDQTPTCNPVANTDPEKLSNRELTQLSTRSPVELGPSRCQRKKLTAQGTTSVGGFRWCHRQKRTGLLVPRDAFPLPCSTATRNPALRPTDVGDADAGATGFSLPTSRSRAGIKSATRTWPYARSLSWARTNDQRAAPGHRKDWATSAAPVPRLPREQW